MGGEVVGVAGLRRGNLESWPWDCGVALPEGASTRVRSLAGDGDGVVLAEDALVGARKR